MLTGFFWDAEPHPIRDTDLFRIRKYFADVYGISNQESIRQAIDITAHNHAFHPIRDKLSKLADEWDGKSRIGKLLPRYLGADESDYTTAVTKMMFYGAIQRAFNPGCKFDYCIILADHRQGTGKSTICRMLALEDCFFTDSLKDMGDLKNSFEIIRGKWVTELGEMLATRKTKDVESIKAYLSRTVDEYRQPYGIYSESYKRQCIFVGTTNRPQFLPDDKSGNRRFLPILCRGKAEKHPLDNEEETRAFILQCYAEAMVSGKEEGFPLVLDPRFEEELDAIREESTPADDQVGMIQGWLDNCGLEYVCTRMIWDEVLAPSDYSAPSRYELQDISDIMNLKIRGWKKYVTNGGKGNNSQHRFGKPYYTQRAWIRVDEDVNEIVNNTSNDVNMDTEFADIIADQTELPFTLEDQVTYW